MPKFTKRAIRYVLTYGPTLIIESFAFKNTNIKCCLSFRVLQTFVTIVVCIFGSLVRFKAIFLTLLKIELQDTMCAFASLEKNRITAKFSFFLFPPI